MDHLILMAGIQEACLVACNEPTPSGPLVSTEAVIMFSFFNIVTTE